MRGSRFTLPSTFGRRGQAVDALRFILPEWCVFVRTPCGGQGRNFRVTTRFQLIVLAILFVLLGWAAYVTYLLSEQPAILEMRERELSEKIVAYEDALERIVAAERLVAGVTREVEEVHSQVASLAEVSSAVIDPAPEIAAFVEVEPSPLLGETVSRTIQSRLVHLETSLNRLRVAQGNAVKRITDLASSRLDQVEQQLARLGLDRGQWGTDAGLGGPFIPALPNAVGDDVGVTALLEKAQAWSGMQSAVQRLPLADPLRAPYRFNSSFGARQDPLNLRTGIHEGIDLGAPTGTPVYATGQGRVTFAQAWDRYGLTVEIDHGQGIVTRYAHLSRIKAKVGQRVDRTTVIGLVGSTGRSTGPHLHYEVRVSGQARNPLKFISVGHNAGKIK